MKSLFKMMFVLVAALGMSAATARAQNCEQSLGLEFLDVNNVRALILNNGGLFYNGDHVYEVPKGSGSNAIFMSSVWVSGFVGNETSPRTAGSTYGPWEFWAGPLDENGEPPEDCSVFDQLYKVNRADVQAYEARGITTPDLLGWPTGLGAPTLAPFENGIDDDEDGEIDEELEQVKFDITVPLADRVNRVIDLAAGERPAILGDMSIWWVMNDRGNAHTRSQSSPIGLEVHGTAFAFNQSGAIGDMTFYKYNVFYKGTEPLERAYLGIVSDPDLGNASDDYVGSDSTLGLGYVYNADDNDEGGEGYGDRPPAAGYDFFQGPIVPSLGDTAQVSGVKKPGFKNLGMTTFAFYNNGGDVTGDPATTEDFYNYMDGRWRDGKQFTFGGNGRDEAGGGSTIPTRFMFSGDPVANTGWTEFNPDPFTNAVPAISPGDRRFAMATGPFTINPGDQQEIVFGLVFAQADDKLESVAKLREVDAAAQAIFDSNFRVPNPPNAPVVEVTVQNGETVLVWTNPPSSNNYLESYAELNTLVVDPTLTDDQRTYKFEGYNVYQYADAVDQRGVLRATYDLDNGVTRVTDQAGPITEIVADGKDGGVQTFHKFSNLTNYTTYYYGVEAYGYNEFSSPKKIIRSPVSRVEVIPFRGEDTVSEAAIAAAESRAEPDLTATLAGSGEGRVWVDIVNPAKVQNATYTVEFYSVEVPAGKIDARVVEEEEGIVDPISAIPQVEKTNAAASYTTFDIKRNGTVVFDGSESGEPVPQRENLTVVDGLQFSVVGPDLGIKAFGVVSNAAGPIDPPDMAAFSFNGWGFPTLEEAGFTPVGTYPDPLRPTTGLQQSTSPAMWGFHAGGGAGPFGPSTDGTSFLGRALRGTNVTRLSFFDWEMRFTQQCADGIDGVIAETDCLAWRGFEDGAIVEVPFELWRVGVGTFGDATDDLRIVPAICEEGCGAGTDSLTYDLGGDHPLSGGDNDPFTDWIYWFLPIDQTAGSAGYQDFFFGTGDVDGEVLARTVLVNFNGGTLPTVNAPLPESGTTFRIYTFKPSQPGDVFTLSTAGFEAAAATQAEKEASLETIGITPNPYKGASIYERSQLVDEVRITNLPEVATIRIFTLHGALIRTLNKNSPERYMTWDLRTENQLPIGSGMYLVHVDVPNVGTQTIKFAVIKKRIQLNVF